jgi:hypothetical protein
MRTFGKYLTYLKTTHGGCLTLLLLKHVNGDVAALQGKRVREADIWYVSYRSNIMPKRDDQAPRSVRATRKFKAEDDAKRFAREVIESGWSAIAGTLNPHTPKKTVSSREILDWIAGIE